MRWAMPLTENFIRKNFGNIQPQEERDYSGPGNTLLYEGWATPGVSTATSGWTIIKHSFNAGNMDTQSQPKIGIIWDLRTIYNYTSP